MADTPVRKRKFNEDDWGKIAEHVSDEFARRKANRRDLERQWDQVDRQLRMEPLPKVDVNGKVISGLEWMSAIELPLQAQARELLNADARRLQFPTDRNFFSAHASMDDGEMRRLQEAFLEPGLDEFNQLALEAVSPGEKQEIDQDDLDALVEGALVHHHKLYDFRGVWDALNGEAFKYGSLVARVMPMNVPKVTSQFAGVSQKLTRRPILLAQSVKNTYLDDTFMSTMHEGVMVAPSFIYSKFHVLDDLMLQAAKGSSEPTSPTGGWRKNALKGLEPLKENKKSVHLLEMEGDFLIPRSSGPSIFLPNAIVTVVQGQVGKEAVSRVIRYRELEFDFRTYLSHPYDVEDVGSPYGVSPLMKGAPVQAAATDAINRIMDSAALQNKPPVWWNPADHKMQALGGPDIFPGALFATLTKPEPIDVGADISALLQTYLTLIGHYAEVTGISAPRLGAQTKSHQTAFAIDTEQTRGVVRTVDYVRSLNTGPMASFLSMEYEMVHKLMPKEQYYIPKFKQYVELKGSMLPKTVTFDVHGAGGPIDEQETAQRKSLALQQAAQLEPVRRQMGEKGMDFDKIQRQILEEGGWVDVEQFFGADSQGVADQSQVSPSSGILQEEPGGALAQLQSAIG